MASLSDEVKAALDVRAALIAAGIEPDDPDMADLLDGETDAIERLRKVLRFARWTEAQAKALGDMLSEGRERKARMERKAESMRNMVLGALSELGLQKLDAPDFTASIRAGKPSVVITDEAAIPDALCRFERKPSKADIAEALAAGPVPGAALSKAAPTLTLRSK